MAQELTVVVTGSTGKQGGAVPRGLLARGGFLDFFGDGYVAMAIEALKLPPDKVDTIADFEAVKRFGVQSKRRRGCRHRGRAR